MTLLRLLGQAAYALVLLPLALIVWNVPSGAARALGLAGTPHAYPVVAGLYILCVAALVFALRIKREELGLRPPDDPRWIWAPAAAMLGVKGLYWAALAAGYYLNGRVLHNFRLSAPDTGMVAASFEILIFAPIVEEIFYRGALYRTATRRLGPVVSLVWIAALFALAHVEWLNGWHRYLASVRALPVHFGIGAALGVIRWRSDSLIPCMTFHYAFNLLQVFAWIEHDVGYR